MTCLFLNYRGQAHTQICSKANIKNATLKNKPTKLYNFWAFKFNGKHN